MNKFLRCLSISILFIQTVSSQEYITRQGQVTFFSYTTVENIEASNNQVLSIIDIANGDIAVSMLMRTFSFKKALMQEHFNESYIESDLYPKATFEGKLTNFDAASEAIQTRMIRGNFTLRGISKTLAIKVQITKTAGGYIISGETEIKIDDFKINVPPILEPNIAKNIKVSFNFQYTPYEE